MGLTANHHSLISVLHSDSRLVTYRTISKKVDKRTIKPRFMANGKALKSTKTDIKGSFLKLIFPVDCNNGTLGPTQTNNEML